MLWSDAVGSREHELRIEAVPGPRDTVAVSLSTPEGNTRAEEVALPFGPAAVAAACVGSVWPVYDGPAAAFAVSFYKAVLDGYPLGEAMRRARKISLDERPGQVTWATFVLYGDPRYRLVD